MVQDAPQTNTTPKPDSGIISQDAEAAQWSPEKVLAELPSRPEANSDSPLPFFHILERLKTTKREGWRRFGINHGESISDHMYRMSILTMFAPPSLASRINIQHCTRMALVHDMAEAIVGDITPIDPVSKEEKSRRETVTMDYLCNNLLGRVAGGLTGQDIRKLWQEYEDSETLESKYVHDIDKMELLLQMMEYERNQEGRLDIGEFTWVATKIVLPEIKEWADQVFEERRQFWIKIGKEPSWGTARR
ncbi:uncharacterized protein K452DRAFT_284617 [Aplosporella prunicola CBS 121167]|uniref:5'-deoxynucleotidase n=1 Tax=Aplosporella prunicola CBS 121167 TaxID=1176127 RepID=A0A6A6BM76_9PEZI|nr:uncharacterized protein K452DRAFT_284617 [Aplosporella prunicola CBS 121167]KAF2145222.1 hypothetical protein K452DRAFT_284617 [Aplosporella prunicola CBS 121167]